MQQRMRRALAEKMLSSKSNECYVLITCNRLEENNSMNVELTYEGDTGLASYLVDKASDYLDEKMIDELE